MGIRMQVIRYLSIASSTLLYFTVIQDVLKPLGSEKITLGSMTLIRKTYVAVNIWVDTIYSS